MAEPTENRRGARAVLANHNFRQLWIGQTISQVGDGLTNLAILIMINRLTGSTTALGVMMVIVALPQLVFGLISGVYVDRWDRKRIMIFSDLLRGAFVLVMVFVRRPEDVWLFYVLGFLQAVVGTFFNPARSALVPSIVAREDLLAANALSQTTQVITGVIGSALAGVLVGVFDRSWPAFSLDALSFFLSAFFISRVQAPSHDALPAGGVRQPLAQLWEGLRYLFGRRLVAGILTAFSVAMLGLGAVNVLVIPFLINQLKVPTEVLGAVDAAQVIGMITGSALVATLAVRLKAEWIIAGGIILVGLFVALFGASTAIPLALIALFLVGLSLTPMQAAAATVFQETIPSEKLGRASSAMNTLTTLTSVVSMGGAGLLGDALGVRQVFYLAGAITIFAGVLASRLMRSPD